MIRYPGVWLSMQLVPKIKRLAALLPIVLASVAVSGTASAAQTQLANVIPLASLSSPGDLQDSPRQIRGDLLLASDGNIYFGSMAGGKGTGAIGKMTPDGTLSVLYALKDDGSEGLNLNGSLMQASDGHLYGTTFIGGSQGGGTLFRVTLDGAFTVLHNFGGGKPNALLPFTGVTEGPDGLLYGTTQEGGDNERGVIYRIARDGTGYTVVHHFNGSNGLHPQGQLVVGADGMLYGTTMLGGSSDRGTIYRISTSGAFERLYSFPSLSAFNSQQLATNAMGANPKAGLLVEPDGSFLGTTWQGGPNGHGTIFRLSPTGEVTLYYAFKGPSFDSSRPLSTLTRDAAGNLYGTSQYGGYLNRGTAWRITPDGTYSLVHAFSGFGRDGALPHAGVLLAHDNLYVASRYDSEDTSGSGTISRLDLGTDGVLPVTLAITESEVVEGSSATITWDAPAGSTCTRIGGTLAWTGDTTGPGSLEVKPAAGVYTYGLSCKDADDGNEATTETVRQAFVAIVVNAPPLRPVDGGGGAGSLSLLWLLAIAALLISRITKENRFPCP